MRLLTEIEKIRIEEFDYQLPDERIAKYPLEKRELSKLLVYNKGEVNHSGFQNITDVISDNSVLVFNNTKVIQARLKFQKETGAKVEIFCLEPHNPTDYNLMFQSKGSCEWKCIVGNLKKWKSGSLKSIININGKEVNFFAEKVSVNANDIIVRFSWDDTSVSFSEILENSGNTPIPPYLNRETEDIDKTRYQTVYSRNKGSVAAPTAGLHFTDEIIEKLNKQGTQTLELTLHVGAGTFKPVQSKCIGDHDMHTEHIVIKKEFLKNLLSLNKDVIAVGTTSVRTLESLYWLGVKCLINSEINISDLFVNQWDPYVNEVSFSWQEAVKAILDKLLAEDLDELKTFTRIMIVPGYKLRLVKALITNFHQPKSTLLLLISAFIGEKWKEVYKYAMENDFRFLSYGDSSILIP